MWLTASFVTMLVYALSQVEATVVPIMMDPKARTMIMIEADTTATMKPM